MARKSLIQRERKRQKLEQKYHLIRRSLKRTKQNSCTHTSSSTLFLTGRPRGNYRDFGLSGHILREMVNTCLVPGATRSSW
uniref:30S ribosomal protein S14, chloroplastic n=1 Tax=Spirodela intermedia TaxID=51605 RepID=A0A8S0XLZ5_SPIIN